MITLTLTYAGKPRPIHLALECVGVINSTTPEGTEGPTTVFEPGALEDEGGWVVQETPDQILKLVAAARMNRNAHWGTNDLH